jgi:SAM-dependent methyltransferase
MNAQTAKILCELNNAFYRENGASFAATRQTPWPGWKRCLEVLRDAGDCPGEQQDLSVFDLACGNLRFQTFLAAALPKTNIAFYAVDNCNDLVPAVPFVHYQSLDILAELQEGRSIHDRVTAPTCDLSVSFGFMHHVPSQEYREKILASLVKQTRPGGYLVVSFWQFLNNETLRDKALVTHRRALEELELRALSDELDANDYLLGWQGIPGAYRYCHSFTKVEIDQLVKLATSRATVVSRFVSDGRTNNLNTYLILRA